MELKQFVKEALTSIIEGVDAANDGHNRFRIIGVKRNIGNLDGSEVEFDVSVVVEQKTGGEAGGKIGVSILNVFSANVDSKVSQTDSHQNVNHLKFKVWVSENELK